MPVHIFGLVFMPDSNSNMAGHCGGLVGSSGFNCIFSFRSKAQDLKSRPSGPWAQCQGTMRTPDVHSNLHFMNLAMNSW